MRDDQRADVRAEQELCLLGADAWLLWSLLTGEVTVPAGFYGHDYADTDQWCDEEGTVHGRGA